MATLTAERPPLGRAVIDNITLAARSQPRWLVIVAALALTAVIGYIDAVTGWELSMFVFYAAPILLVVWYGGRGLGWAAAVVCAVVWHFSNQTEQPYQTEWGYFVATFSRFVYFSVVVIAGNAVKDSQIADRSRIAALERSGRLEQEIVNVSEHEQRRIGQDLHDGICQQLAAIGCAARALADDLKERQVPEAADAETLEELLKETTIQARSLARSIFPVQMDQAGLSVALDELAATTCKLTGASVSFEESGDTRLDKPEQATHLYRIAQEALSNAIKHSQASHITISLHGTLTALTLTVADDGTGFRKQQADFTGMGTRTMQYRARQMKAGFAIKNRSAGGVAVTCTIHRNILPLPNLVPA